MKRSRLLSLLCALSCLAVSLTDATPALASSRSQARRLYRRIAGVSPTTAQVEAMAPLLAAGKVEEAARIPLGSDDFIDHGAKRLVVPWTDIYANSQKTIGFSTALMLGLIRDDLPFDQALYGDTFYVGSPEITSDDNVARVLPPSYLALSLHFQLLDNHNLNEPHNPFLLNPNNYDDVYLPNLTQRIMTSKFLVKVPQEGFMDRSYTHYNEPSWTLQPPWAGVMTAQDFARAFYSMGTNRRPIKFLMQNFLCKTLDQLMDVSLSDAYVRRDVDRSPGGDSRTYKQRCIGCHSGIDAISGAFAHYDINKAHIADVRSSGQRQVNPYEPGSPLAWVHDKMNRNYVNYPLGHITMDSSWVNLWVGPHYADIGWRGAMSGTGPKELGQMLARSEAFANCTADHAFEYLCQHRPDGAEQARLHDTARAFETDMHYSMKSLIAKIAAEPSCLGEGL